MSLLRLWPRLVVDCVPRLLVLLLLFLLLLWPLLLLRGAGRVAGPVMPVTSAPLRWVLLAGALVMWEGAASRPRREGTDRAFLARPVSRGGFLIAQSSSRLFALAALAVGVAALAGPASGLMPSVSVLGAGVAAAATGLLVGSVVLLASVLLDRGDVLVVVMLWLLGIALRSVPPESPLFAPGRWLGVPGVALEGVQRSLLAGSMPTWSDGALVLCAGGTLLVLAAALASRREHRAA